MIRWGTDLSRVPGVYQDSLTYLKLSSHAPYGPYSPTRPSGYPLMLRVIRVAAAGLDPVTAVQHAAGLAVGALVYALLVRAGTRRWVATAATAVVVLDAYAVALEQDVLAETLFTLALTASVYLVLRWRVTLGTVVASGLLLALAATMRTVGLFAIPVWVVYLVWTRPGRQLVTVGIAAVAVPILLYCSLHSAAGDGFSLVDSDGWYLYAKVGPIVDCSGVTVPHRTRALCVPPPSKDTNFYLYDSASPARRLFGAGANEDVEEEMTPTTNALLRRFCLAVILRHPIPYVRAVATDFVHYLGPAKGQPELSLYGQPGSLILRYERWFHTWWWIVAPAFVAGMAAALFSTGRREVCLLLAMASALLLGAAALSGFNIRYVVPASPFIVAAGAIAVEMALGRRTATSGGGVAAHAPAPGPASD